MSTMFPELMRGVLRVGKSPVHGRGVLVKRRIRAGTPLFRVLGREGQTPASKLVNHSPRPNSYVGRYRGHRHVVAGVDLPSGSEILVNYDNVKIPEKNLAALSLPRSSSR